MKIGRALPRDYVKPSEVKITTVVLRPIRYANELKRKRRQWELGVPPYSSLFIGWGVVSIKALPDLGFSVTRLRTAAGVYTVRWFAGVIPPIVKHGASVVVVGRIGTMATGKEASLTDAMVIGNQRGAMRRSLTWLFRRHVMHPQEFMDFPDEWKKPLVG